MENIMNELKPEELKPDIDPSDTTQVTSVINPYALAEIVAGRKIAWKEVSDVPRFLEDLFQFPYEELFDPKYGGPLYTGLEFDEKFQSRKIRSPLLDVKRKEVVNDLAEADRPNIAKISDLAKELGTTDVGNVHVHNAEIVNHNYIQLKVPLPERDRVQRLAAVLMPDVVRTIADTPPIKGRESGVESVNYTWSDPGRFFDEAAEVLDPVQGGVGNCYFIAALSAVAWALPYEIKHMTRATGTSQQRFTNMIQFYDKGKWNRVEVTDAVPIYQWGGFVYGRSRESGEIWPAVYEKAFAKYITGVTHDRPNIPSTAYGDPVRSTVLLTGRKGYYYSTNRTVPSLMYLIKSNSRSYKTFNPMVAWTFSSDAAAKNAGRNIRYRDANIVANHAYTIMGWAFRNDKYYVILRNPWGRTEASINTLGGYWWSYDVSFWRPINLAVNDGVFALEASTFLRYYRGFGVARP